MVQYLSYQEPPRRTLVFHRCGHTLWSWSHGQPPHFLGYTTLKALHARVFQSQHRVTVHLGKKTLGLKLAEFLLTRVRCGNCQMKVVLLFLSYLLTVIANRFLYSRSGFNFFFFIGTKPATLFQNHCNS